MANGSLTDFYRGEADMYNRACIANYGLADTFSFFLGLPDVEEVEACYSRQDFQRVLSEIA